MVEPIFQGSVIWFIKKNQGFQSDKWLPKTRKTNHESTMYWFTIGVATWYTVGQWCADRIDWAVLMGDTWGKPHDSASGKHESSPQILRNTYCIYHLIDLYNCITIRMYMVHRCFVWYDISICSSFKDDEFSYLQHNMTKQTTAFRRRLRSHPVDELHPKV